MMLDAAGERAAEVIASQFAITGGSFDTFDGQAVFARDVAQALADAGLLARCSCPVGFGSVADGHCPIHRRHV